MEKVKTLKVQTVPKLIIPIDLPKDPEGDGDEFISLQFEIKRQTPKNISKVVNDTKDLKEKYHMGEIDDMEYSRDMLGVLCEKTHWHILQKYDLLYINQIMEHILKETENYKKKFSGSTPSKT
jgi:hypothetical protein